MSRTTAIVLLLIGILLFMGSCAPIGYVIYLDALVKPAAEVPLSRDGSTDRADFTAIPGTLARFSVQARITTASVQEDPDSLNGKYEARFRFPIHFTITDSGGRVLARADKILAWKNGGSITIHDEHSSSTGATLTASTSLGKFTVPADGRVHIELAMDNDTTYKASYTALQLQFYEDMIDDTWYLAGGVMMGIGGFLLAMAGFIFLLISAARASSQLQPAAGPDTAVASCSSDINTNAMIIQLSAFAGYFVPFGNIILPVILWLVWRNRDPYLDRMGCEAVNFQLSMLIYYLICFILMFVLIGFLLIFAAMIFHLSFTIVAAVQRKESWIIRTTGNTGMLAEPTAF